MYITDKNVDGGKAFDWGKTSADYARYRDIYPQEFYDKITSRCLCITGQNVLDIGTGTGVLPRNMYRYGAKWTGTDISKHQIEQAKMLSSNMDIKYYVLPTENIDFLKDSFDVVTACQCFWYFDHEHIIPKLYDMLKSNGKILILYMAWLPFEDKIAGASENLVLKYNPEWNGCGERIHPISIPECYHDKFEFVYHEEYPLSITFTRESWHGRMKACRGVGASLSEDKVALWEEEHIQLLNEIAPPKFEILHYGAIAELKKI